MTYITQILSAINVGGPLAAEQFLPLVRDPLRRVAAAELGQEPLSQVLQATALAHEALLKFVGDRRF